MRQSQSLGSRIILEGRRSPFDEDRGLQPPCQAACPLHQDVRGYLAYISQGEFNDALRVIKETNPLPSVCGNICAHPCETQCRRGQVDRSLAICALKRFATEFGGSILPAKSEVRRTERVAIVGSGPAGLTAAHDLARLGYGVVIFERESLPGGALRSYLPKYRLPRHALEKDIEEIVALGVEIETNTEFGRDVTVQSLKSEGYQAVLLTSGLPLSRGLPIPGAESKDVLLALPFLKGVNSGECPIEPGKKVVVIGGGNVAIDVARSALRSGAKEVQLACLEARNEMPCFPWELEAALEEGIQVFCSKGPKRVLTQDGRVTGVEFMEVKTVFDEAGRFNPSFYEDQLSTLAGDIVILAIGQASNLSLWKDMGIDLSQRGQLVFDPHTQATSVKGVFAGGEVISGPGSAVAAMASGRKAAMSIHRYLRGEPLLAPEADEPEELGNLSSETIKNVKRVDRKEMPALAVEERVGNFEQIELGYTEELAMAEARRCLSCGAGAEILQDKCATCLTCLRICPYGVPVMVDGGLVEIRDEQCQACGLCVAECPARAIAFRLHQDEKVAARIEQVTQEVLASNIEPAIVGLCCGYGAYTLNGFADFLDGKRPPNVGIVKIPCLARINVTHVLRPLEMGADGVFVSGCREEECPYPESNPWVKRRLESVKKVLGETGFGDERLMFYERSSSENQQFDQVVDEVTQRVKGLTPNPRKRKEAVR